ncbi:MAG: dockerin type I domain-containing protein [Pseudomonadota bacterium]
MLPSKTAASTTLALVLLATLPSYAPAELHSRLGGTAAYDDALDITWLTDASASGAGSWDDQLAWVVTLNQAAHLGFTDWRLASMSTSGGLPVGQSSDIVDCSTIWQPLCADNELGYMFFHNLGGTTGQDLTGTRTIGGVTLENIQPLYWSGTQSGTSNAWMYHFDIGFGVWSPRNGMRYGWVVRDGDVALADSDADGVPDGDDNCLTIANADQRDTDGDGHGNACDPDLNNDDAVNFLDLALLKAVFFTDDQDADLNGDGVVNFADLAIMKALFFQSPG